MYKAFIESHEFTKDLIRFFSDDEYAALQLSLMKNPNAGTVVPGCGGIRKLRAVDPRRGKGKRGGVRVIYLYVPEGNCIFLLRIYHKGERDNLNASQTRVLRRLATQLRNEIIEAARRHQKRD